MEKMSSQENRSPAPSKLEEAQEPRVIRNEHSVSVSGARRPLVPSCGGRVRL